ncbi:hypothetical protein HYH03_001717 [Edaphochlamys debaryana]|uniref:MYND-type domain-containing protein n=1 Tax=Edaphochlamys debaryana TaxID=47281 RepID=A0A835YBY8_9CHLO|nr:hypothetical protein HYH03_001714 [Edaphochlamys debaryana]KAG2500135.1 hypothetical protein HYH03_001717 [Edaphochlamys debaryana]|eukprot:KAG2500132.1 hypothetical protein HYH03_001714 [Edaphochlamys debaryana]
MLYAAYLTAGVVPPAAPETTEPVGWQVGKHVEQYTGVQFRWADATGRVVSDAEAARRRAQQGQRRGGGLRPAVVVMGNVDADVYHDWSAEQLAVTLLMLAWDRLSGRWAVGFTMAQSLFVHPHNKQRVQEVLLPALAAMDVGEPHHMTAPQWETVWLETLAPYVMFAIQQLPAAARSGEPGAPRVSHLSTVLREARSMLRAMGERLVVLQPQRPLAYRWLALSSFEAGDHDSLFIAASELYSLGEDQGHDLALCVGGFMRLYALQQGVTRPVPVTRVQAGALQEMFIFSSEAGMRLERLDLWDLVKSQMDVCAMAVMELSAQLQGVPGEEEVSLPYRGRTTQQPRAQTQSHSRTRRSQPAGRNASGAASAPAPAAEAEEEEPSVAELAAAAARAEAQASWHACDACGGKFEKLNRCGGCRQRRYCGKECQTKDWRAGHKEACKQLAAAAQAEGEA